MLGLCLGIKGLCVSCSLGKIIARTCWVSVADQWLVGWALDVGPDRVKALETLQHKAHIGHGDHCMFALLLFLLLCGLEVMPAVAV